MPPNQPMDPTITGCSVAKIRINDLARELGVKSLRVISSLSELGENARKGHSSSVDSSIAERVREYFKSGSGRLESSISPGIRPLSASLVPLGAEVRRPRGRFSSSGQAFSTLVSEPVAPEMRLETKSAESDLRQLLIAKGLIRPVPSSANGERRLIRSHSVLSTKKEDLPISSDIGRDHNQEPPPQVSKLKGNREKKKNKKNEKKTGILKHCDECPHCHRHFRRTSLEKHLLSDHPEIYRLPEGLTSQVTSPEPPTRRDWSYEQVSCPKCHRLMPSCALEAHVAEKHTTFYGLATRFPFELLPPGNLLEALKKFSCTNPNRCINKIYDLSRLTYINNFEPTARHGGRRGWKGYVVFEFQSVGKAVLECPRTGNATYILKGDWRTMIYLTKAELRSEYQQFTERVCHTAGWEDRVRTALLGSKNAAPSWIAIPTKRG
jgi:Translation initiation factor IF-2, N-terminal region